MSFLSTTFFDQQYLKIIFAQSVPEIGVRRSFLCANTARQKKNRNSAGASELLVKLVQD